jgi:hypothetical protein
VHGQTVAVESADLKIIYLRCRAPRDRAHPEGVRRTVYSTFLYIHLQRVITSASNLAPFRCSMLIMVITAWLWT